MRQFLYLIILLCFCRSLSAQDYLSAPGSNPALFSKSKVKLHNNKLLVTEDAFVYRYDTLKLPFIDDFSRDHFPKRLKDTADPRLSDTLIYQILIGGVPYRESGGFKQDTTGYFLYDSTGILISKTANQDTTIEFFDLSNFPPKKQTLIVYPAYNVYDTVGGSTLDTIPLMPDYISDSIRFYIVGADRNDFYTNRSTYLNSTFPINPPSIGVATFDGLDEFGLPYDIGNPRQVKADELSSVPIDLSNLPDNDVFFSFFYEPQGLSIDKPEPEDSLALDFFNVTAQKWQNVWRVPGFGSDSFKLEIIKVPDSLQKNGFRFRFRNYASSTGGFDQWHLDYIYLNNGRSINDTTFNDLAFVYDAPGLLKDYTAMPWFHFQMNPAQFMTDSTFTLVKNSSSISLQVYNKLIIPDTVPNPDTIYYRYPQTDKFSFLPPSVQFNFKYLINFDYSVSDVDTAGVFECTYDIDFRPGTNQEKDFIRSNDTVIGKTVLKDYYAYDDGTAEAGYGINPAQSNGGYTAFMAVEFNIPVKDSIGGVQLYFLPQGFDVRKQQIQLTVWNSLSPPNVIFEMPITYNPQYTDDNGYLTYYFDSLVGVNQTFYAGFKAIGLYSLNVGYDLNRNNRDKIFWSYDGNDWFFPSAGIRDGSLMLRPVFQRTARGVGIKEIPATESQYTIYPNPTNGILNIVQKGEQNNMKELLLMNLQGKLIFRKAFVNTLDLSGFSPGIYFLTLTNFDNQQITKKVIVSP